MLTCYTCLHKQVLEPNENDMGPLYITINRFKHEINQITNALNGFGYNVNLDGGGIGTWNGNPTCHAC